MSGSKKRIALIMGTRPEVIKCAPLVRALRHSRSLEPIVIASGQHNAMAQQAFEVFDFDPDIQLDLMRENQTPNSFLSRLLIALEEVLNSNDFSGVIVQGDTTTALGGGIAAFHQEIPVAHVEAGLRTFRHDAPFPEEMNRTTLSHLSSLHFAPTQRAAENLRKESIASGVHVVGNTIVDALETINSSTESGSLKVDDSVAALISSYPKRVLVTGHRRENFDMPMENLCKALLQLRDSFAEHSFIFCVHLNPRVQSTVHEILSDQERIHLLPPVDYPSMLALLKGSSLVISDSGGIQEEVASLRTRVLVTREITERPEAIDAGFALLTPLEDPSQLVAKASEWLKDPDNIPKGENPFGDGHTAEKITKILEEQWGG